ncbi:MAG: glycine zipper 2TM domain-containing protein [Rudaea sp.]
MNMISIIAASTMLLAASMSAQAQSRSASVVHEDNSRFGWADVLRVDPVYDENAAADQPTPQPCYEEQVPIRNPPVGADDSGKRTVGGVLGAIVGGILGHQVGKGDGRKLATAGGVVAGAVVGSNVAADKERDRDDAPKYTIERRCPGAEPGARKVAAYDVEYRYRGDVYTSRLSYDPGDRIRVKVNVSPAD